MNWTILRFTAASAFRWRVCNPLSGVPFAGASPERASLRAHEVRYATPIQVRQIIAPFESVSQKSPMESP